MNDILQQLAAHRSIRRFQPERVPDEEHLFGYYASKGARLT